MASKHHLANSNKEHSGNDPKYMQKDTGPKQAIGRFVKAVGGHNTAPAKGKPIR